MSCGQWEAEWSVRQLGKIVPGFKIETSSGQVILHADTAVRAVVRFCKRESLQRNIYFTLDLFEKALKEGVDVKLLQQAIVGISKLKCTYKDRQTDIDMIVSTVDVLSNMVKKDKNA